MEPQNHPGWKKPLKTSPATNPALPSPHLKWIPGKPSVSFVHMNSSTQLCIRTVPATAVITDSIRDVSELTLMWAGGQSRSWLGIWLIKIWTLTADPALLHLHWKMSLYSSKLHQNEVWHLGLDESKRWCSLMAVSVNFPLLLLILLSDIASKPGLISHSKNTWLSFAVDHWNYTTG